MKLGFILTTYANIGGVSNTHVGNIETPDKAEALKRLAKRYEPEGVYFALVRDASEQDVQPARYLSDRAATFLYIIERKTELERDRPLLVDVNPTSTIKPRIESLELGKWVPLEELTEDGWIKIDRD